MFGWLRSCLPCCASRRAMGRGSESEPLFSAHQPTWRQNLRHNVEQAWSNNPTKVFLAVSGFCLFGTSTFTSLWDMWGTAGKVLSIPFAILNGVMNGQQMTTVGFPKTKVEAMITVLLMCALAPFGLYLGASLTKIPGLLYSLGNIGSLLVSYFQSGGVQEWFRNLTGQGENASKYTWVSFIGCTFLAVCISGLIMENNLVVLNKTENGMVLQDILRQMWNAIDKGLEKNEWFNLAGTAVCALSYTHLVKMTVDMLVALMRGEDSKWYAAGGFGMLSPSAIGLLYGVFAGGGEMSTKDLCYAFLGLIASIAVNWGPARISAEEIVKLFKDLSTAVEAQPLIVVPGSDSDSDQSNNKGFSFAFAIEFEKEVSDRKVVEEFKVGFD